MSGANESVTCRAWTNLHPRARGCDTGHRARAGWPEHSAETTASGRLIPDRSRRVFSAIRKRVSLDVLVSGPSTPARRTARDDERGVALIVVLMATLLLGAVGAALVMVTSADVLIAANTGAANEVLYAAEAGFERTLGELRDTPELTSILNGSVTSAFLDGAPGGQRTMADGSRIDLGQILSLATCDKPTACSASDINVPRDNRPWGALNPRWRLLSYGPLDPAPSGIRSGLPVYVVSMVADDPSDTDGDPTSDGTRTGVDPNPGAGVVLVRAEAFGRRGAHRILEGAVVRRDLQALARWEAADPAVRGSPPSPIPFLQVVAWREVH
jgi:hypothetical protein